jgi:hypothetical protein
MLLASIVHSESYRVVLADTTILGDYRIWHFGDFHHNLPDCDLLAS